MADARQIMSWLEGLMEDDWRMYHSDSEVQTIAKAALDLLKEQEPVKPKTDDAWPSRIKVCGACGTCLFEVGDYKPKYCSECGRMVDWH
jgi:hypothetical protein